MSMKQQPRGVVLVVEDDPDIRDTIAQILQEEGYQVRAASNGQEALKLLEAGPVPKLILLDLMMPVMDGWLFRAEQQKMAPPISEVPVVVLSADGNVRQQAVKLKANGALRKPVGIDVLLATVERYAGS
jgi:CheY-like chemotaxis protein